MFEEIVPKKKIGVLAPLPVIDNQPYMFYRLVPKDVMLVMTPVGLAEFTRDDVERVFEPLDELVDALVGRGADIILQAGVPLPILIGVDAHDRLLARIEERSGVPATSQIEGVVAAARHLGIKNLVCANKWSDEMNATLAEFFDRAGVAVCGVASEVLAPSQFQAMGTEESMRLGYELGRQAFEKHPEADALYLGGGAWISQPVVQRLEEEYGKPAICNQCAMTWNLLHRLDMWQPIAGRGRLLGGD